MADKLRQAVISVLGHVDHGKTKLLDKIRGTATQSGEAGGITQAIGASIIPLETINDICGKLIDKQKFTIPGLLFIDTPGHAAFTTLRRRGGSIADIAILVVDITDGLMPQTMESIEILKNFKTPFIIAANKIDLIPGYREKNKKSLLANLKEQDPFVQEKIDTKIYEIVGELHKHGFASERFDRIDNFTKQIGIIPVSAITGDGVPELLMVLIGLAQKYLEDSLKLHVTGNAKGVVLEVKETTGLGKTLDVIIYDGTLKRNDNILIGGLDGAIKTRVKALLCPLPLKEMRDKKTKFEQVKEIVAATGIKLCAPDTDEVIAGMPLQSYDEKNEEKVMKEIEEEVNEVIIETDDAGIIIKSDTLGSLESLTTLLKE